MAWTGRTSVTTSAWWMSQDRRTSGATSRGADVIPGSAEGNVMTVQRRSGSSTGRISRCLAGGRGRGVVTPAAGVGLALGVGHDIGVRPFALASAPVGLVAAPRRSAAPRGVRAFYRRSVESVVVGYRAVPGVGD